MSNKQIIVCIYDSEKGLSWTYKYEMFFLRILIEVLEIYEVT